MSESPHRVQANADRLVVSMPHVGRRPPADVRSMLSPAVRSLDDADWHVDRLYDFLGETDASSIAATWSRWLVDLNRPPDDASLYPGQAATALCPELRFSGGPLYLDGRQPDAAEVERRLRIYRQPYHRQLGELINAARAARMGPPARRAFDRQYLPAVVRTPSARHDHRNERRTKLQRRAT